MFGDFGFVLLFLASIVSLYSVGASLLSVRLRHAPLLLSAKLGAGLVCALTLSAALLLFYLFYEHDFSVQYVQRNSSTDLPIHFLLSAFWAALEGSHLLWTLLLSIVSAVAIWTVAADNRPLLPYLIATLQSVLSWMLILALTYSDPFKPLFPAPAQGAGLNALLQNIYMTIHPPSLFTGYTSLAVPFAYSIAAMCYGKFPGGWTRTVRRWTLFAWAFLTFGITLGGRWAYVELGWGGYWAWDPVENSSFIPWLFATALLHTLSVQAKMGQLGRMSLLLSLFGFFFSYLGTFITRSGIISSVHSFAQSPIGPAYLSFLFVLAFSALLLYAWRAPKLSTLRPKYWGISRESALVFTQFLLILFAMIVSFGTLYPIISEALTGQRFNIQAPYFNTFAPFIGFGLAAGIGFGNLLRFQTNRPIGGFKTLLLTFLFSLPLSLLYGYFTGVHHSPLSSFLLQSIGIVFCLWAFMCLVWDLNHRLQALSFRMKTFFRYNLSYAGSWLAHVGVLVGIIGFLGNYRGFEKTVTLHTGDRTTLMGYEIQLEGIRFKHVENMGLYYAALSVSAPGGALLAHINPGRAKYPTSEDWFNEVDTWSTFWHDLYAVLARFDPDKQEATLQLYLNPTVRLVWSSIALMIFGSLLCLVDRRYRSLR
jgi:cytochrome c-type biogenesis protein CcmF